MVMGYPASGKSKLTADYVACGHERLNRDESGGKVIDLLPKMISFLKAGKNVVLDNLFVTAEQRKPFVEAAKKAGANVKCDLMMTSIEDSTINALHRMWQKHGKIFFDPSDLKGVNDSNMFPIAVLFKYRKEYEKPSTSEGFSSIREVEFHRLKSVFHTNGAFIFDYDGTLRTSKNSKLKFPTCPEEVVIMPGRKEKMQALARAGHLLLGVSNQSGIARMQMGSSEAEGCEAAEAAFYETNRQLGLTIDCVYCKHNVPPNCYCRKPQSGLGVHLICKYNLDPTKCVYVGDQTTDKTFAKRLGMVFEYAEQFFES